MKPKILVVDDLPELCEFLQMELEDCGFEEVHIALDGQKAFEFLLENPDTEFVISDINMPNWTGVDLLMNMKANELLKHIPIVFFSSEFREEEIVKVLNLGAQGFYQKPYQSNDVIGFVQAFLSHGKKEAA